jgi:hypothetical protein
MRRVLAIVLILAGYAVGQATKAPQAARAPKSPAEAIESSHVGRYQIFFSPHARADVYLVDTETGRIWKPITISNAKDDNFKTAPELWVYQDRVDNETGFDFWMALHKQPAPPPSPPPATPQ